MRAFFFIFSLVIAPLAAQTPIERLDQLIESAMVQYGVPGASVSVVKDGEVVLNRGYGVRTAGETAKVDEQTIFQLASIAKTFTAAAVALQVQAGKMDWDDPLINHLPGFALESAYATRFATARDLLAHRSALPPFQGDLLGDLGFTRDQILFQARYLEPIYSFRERAGYSNVGYFIAGQLAARLSGQGFEELIRTSFFHPLGMSRSGFADLLKGSNVSSNHVMEEGEPVVTPAYDSNLFAAAGGVVSSAADMAKWMVMLLNQGRWQSELILRRSLIEAMFAPSMVASVEFSEAPPIDESAGFAYAMGWGNYHYGGQMVVEKGGGLPGVRTLTTLVPEEKIGITILCNLGLSLFPEAVRAHFLELFVAPSSDDLGAEIAARQPELEQMGDPPPVIAHPIPLCVPLSNVAGTYHSELYGDFVLQIEGDGLSVFAGESHYAGKLTPYSTETFILHWEKNPTAWQEVTFLLGSDGKAKGLATETLGTFERIP